MKWVQCHRIDVSIKRNGKYCGLWIRTRLGLFLPQLLWNGTEQTHFPPRLLLTFAPNCRETVSTQLPVSLGYSCQWGSCGNMASSPKHRKNYQSRLAWGSGVPILSTHLDLSLGCLATWMAFLDLDWHQCHSLALPVDLDSVSSICNVILFASISLPHRPIPAAAGWIGNPSIPMQSGLVSESTFVIQSFLTITCLLMLCAVFTRMNLILLCFRACPNTAPSSWQGTFLSYCHILR